MLADRARVLGGLPDVVTIQEGKVSTELSSPCFFTLAMASTASAFVPSFKRHPTLFIYAWLLMLDFKRAKYRVENAVMFAVILIFWAKHQDASLSDAGTCRPLSRVTL